MGFIKMAAKVGVFGDCAIRYSLRLTKLPEPTYFPQRFNDCPMHRTITDDIWPTFGVCGKIADLTSFLHTGQEEIITRLDKD